MNAKPTRLTRIYQCLCDPTRLRILNLLRGGELCVCHIQEVLAEPQVKVSKHLAYLRVHGLVAARREANWIVYRLPDRPSKELSANLACLQDCAAENPVFGRDTARLGKLKAGFEACGPACCAAGARRPQSSRRRAA
jgi:ArsR family transcriptional regulator